MSDGTPSGGLLDVLGVLRRPPTGAELNLVHAGSYGVGPMTTVYRRYSRIVTGPHGLRATITVGIGQQYRPPLLYDPHCVDAVKKALAPRLRHEPAAVRKDVAQALHAVSIPPGPREQLNFTVGPGGTGGPWEPLQFKAHGLFLSSGSGGPLLPGVGGAHTKHTSHPRAPHSVLAGLVPDGVTSVTLRLPKRVARWPFAPTDAYSGAYTATARVHDNVVFFARVPRDAPDAFGPMIWRGTHGQILRVAGPPS